MHAPIEFRAAGPDDVLECIQVRGLTRENPISVSRLASMGITHASWCQSVCDLSLTGVVCVAGGQIIGYCFGGRHSGEIVVLALLPAFEGRGIGRALLAQVMSELAAQGHRRMFLGCSPDPGRRSFGFYRHLGWRSTHQCDANGDEILEHFVAMHRSIPN